MVIYVLLYKDITYKKKELLDKGWRVCQQMRDAHAPHLFFRDVPALYRELRAQGSLDSHNICYNGNIRNGGERERGYFAS